MNTDVRRKINDIAESIRDILGLSTPIEINDMEKVIKKINGRVIQNADIWDFVDGKIYREADGFVIEIPWFQSEYRNKFTITHELGHLFLHMGYLIDDELWEMNREKIYLRKEIGEMEYQANEFAGSFLMPRKEFFEVMKENYIGNGQYNMERVAEHFKVSKEAAVNRGRWLELLSWGE